MSSLQNMSNWQLYQSFTDINKKLWTKLEMARRRNQIPSTSETNLYFANIMLIAFCVQPPAIFLHSGGKFPSCCSAQLISFEIDCFYGVWTRIYCYGHVSSCWNKLLTTCNKLDGTIRRITRLFQQDWYSRDITIILQPYVVKFVTTLIDHNKKYGGMLILPWSFAKTRFHMFKKS